MLSQFSEDYFFYIQSVGNHKNKQLPTNSKGIQISINSTKIHHVNYINCAMWSLSCSFFHSLTHAVTATMWMCLWNTLCYVSCISNYILFSNRTIHHKNTYTRQIRLNTFAHRENIYTHRKRKTNAEKYIYIYVAQLPIYAIRDIYTNI